LLLLLLLLLLLPLLPSLLLPPGTGRWLPLKTPTPKLMTAS